MDIFFLIFKNIKQRKTRTLTNILIITVAGCAFILSGSLGDNISSAAESDFLQKGIPNEIIVESININEMLNENDVLILKEIKNINYVTPFYSEFMGIQTTSNTLNSMFRATTTIGYNLDTLQSIILNQQDTTLQNYVLVPHIFYANNEVFFGENLLGTSITFQYADKEENLYEFERTIIGVYDQDSIDLPTNAILFDITDLFEIISEFNDTSIEQFKNTLEYDYLNVYVDDLSNLSEVKSQIKLLGYQASDINNQLEDTPGIVQYIIWIGGVFGILALISGSISITMTIIQVINNRKKEVGTLKALGFSNHNIRCLFVNEILIVGIIASIFSILISYIILLVISPTIANLFAESFKPRITGSILLISIALNVSVPVLASLFPIIKLSNIEAAISMKEE